MLWATIAANLKTLQRTESLYSTCYIKSDYDYFYSVIQHHSQLFMFPPLGARDLEPHV